MATDDKEPIRVTGCLPYRDAVERLFELGESLVAMGRPELVSLEKWGRGWAVFLNFPEGSL